MKRCNFYLHGRPSKFLTDLYNAIERPRPDVNMIHDILKNYNVIQQRYGQMFIYQGEDSSIALNHVRRINRRYPGLIDYEYKGQTTSRFGKGLNEKYGKGSLNIETGEFTPEDSNVEETPKETSK